MAKVSQKHLQQLLNTLCAKHNVVGASLAILYDEQIETVASGLLNIETGVEVTIDSLFQIGSITKVFTATLIMQLLDEGRLDLDLPVKTYLPTFQLADAEAASKITVRQLLCHTNGMAGDFFPEDDLYGASISGFVERCSLLPQAHPVGEYFSYSNSGYTLAGRLIEVLTGLPWSQAIFKRIIRPLGLEHSTADLIKMLRYRMAIGHLTDPDDSKVQRISSQCYLPLSLAPAGTVLSMSAKDLLTFSKMHMNSGRNAEGKRLVSERSVEQMKQVQVSLPEHSSRGVTDWGLGWFLFNQQSLNYFGHDGATLGQYSYLRVFPKQGLSIALLTNSLSREIFNQIQKQLLLELVNIELPADPETINTPIDLQRFPGRYESLGSIVTISNRNGLLEIKTEEKLSANSGSSNILHAIDKDCFIVKTEQGELAQNVRFIGSDSGGAAEYFFSEFRLLKRLSD